MGSVRLPVASDRAIGGVTELVPLGPAEACSPRDQQIRLRVAARIALAGGLAERHHLMTGGSSDTRRDGASLAIGTQHDRLKAERFASLLAEQHGRDAVRELQDAAAACTHLLRQHWPLVRAVAQLLVQGQPVDSARIAALARS